jgi:hypothetical protein
LILRAAALASNSRLLHLSNLVKAAIIKSSFVPSIM